MYKNIIFRGLRVRSGDKNSFSHGNSSSSNTLTNQLARIFHLPFCHFDKCPPIKMRCEDDKKFRSSSTLPWVYHDSHTSVCRRASDNREAFSAARYIVLIFMREAQWRCCVCVPLDSPASAKKCIKHTPSTLEFLVFELSRWEHIELSLKGSSRNIQ